MTEPLDTEYTDDLICPCCGHVVQDVFEYELSENCERIACPSCDERFDACAHLDVSYSSFVVDKEREAVLEKIAEAERKERWDLCSRFTPGSQVRLADGRLGVVANAERHPDGFARVLVGRSGRLVDPAHLSLV